MEPIVKTLFLTLFLFSSINSVPLNLINEDNNPIDTCRPRQCQPDPRFIRFSNKKSYEYKFESKTWLTDGATHQPLTLEGAVVVDAINDCHLALRVTNAQIEGVSGEYAQLMVRELETTPLHFGYSDGHVTDVCVEQSDVIESDWSMNVKKALISALQMTTPSLTTDQRVYEDDFNGHCLTTYRPISEKYGKHVIRKTKFLNDCQRRQEWTSGVFPRAYGVYGRQKSIPIINGTQDCLLNVHQDLIQGVTCEERQHVFFGKQFSIKSVLNLRFERQVDFGIRSEKNWRLRRHLNHLKMTNTWNKSSNEGKEDLKSVLRDLCENRDQRKAAKEFQKLIKSLKYSSWDQIKEVKNQLKQSCSTDGDSVEDLFYQACAQAGSEGSARALKEWFENNNNNNNLKTDIIFRSLSFVSQPEVKAAEYLTEILIKNPKQSHVVLGVTSFIHNLKHVSKEARESVREYEERAIKSLAEVTSSGGIEEKIVAIKGIQNIGLERSESGRRQMALLVRNGEEGVRVAALQCLRESGVNGAERETVITAFESEENTNDVRIQAYKTLIMNGIKKEELIRIKEVLKKSNNKDVQQYIRTHQKNIKESSDPHKKDVQQQLNTNNVQFEEPLKQWMGLSNNYETSFMLDAMGMGAVMEGDVIYGKNKIIPTSLMFNTTLPLFGRQLNVICVELRQKGFENILEQNFIEKLQNSVLKDRKRILENILETLKNLKNSAHAQNAYFEAHVQIDGKTIIVYDSRVQSRVEWQQVRDLVTRGAIGMEPINTRLVLPSVGGWPVVARANSTLVWRVTRVGNKVNPQLNWETEMKMEIMTRDRAEREVGGSVAVRAFPVWESTWSESGRGFDWTVGMKEARVTLMEAEMDYSGVGTGSSFEKCSKFTQKPLGIEFCFAKNDKKMEIFIKKIDKTLNQYVLHASRDNYNWRVHFNTPNSQVNREMSLETRVEGQEARVQSNILGNRYSARVLVKQEENNKGMSFSVEKNDKPEVEAEVGLEMSNRGQKREFRPKVKVTWSGRQLVDLTGSVSLSKGRKNQLMINLEGNQKQFLKGSLVREGERKSSDIRLSSDLILHLFNGFEVKLNALLDKSPKHVTNDVQIEYKPNSQHARKESIKVSLKVQELSAGTGNRKSSAFMEVTTTQWPTMNCHVAYNLLNKVREHVENELTVQWGERMSKKIHLLQVSKWNDSAHVQNTLNVEVTPLDIDYELRANGMLNRDERRGDVQGKDRSGKNTRNDFKATFQYKHVSHAPLHLTLEANLKTGSGSEFQYKDELREEEKNSYNGVTSVQWGQGGKLKAAKMDYKYRMNDQWDHDLDLNIQSPFTNNIHHNSRLRMTRQDLNLKSRLLIGQHLNHNLDTLLTNQGRSHLEWEGLGYTVKGHAHPYVLPQVGGVEVTVATPTQFSHKSDLEILPKNYLKLKSETKLKNQNIFAIDGQLAKQGLSKVDINSPIIETRIDMKRNNGRVGEANVHVKHLGEDWIHSSSYKQSEDKNSIEIKSKTISKSNPLMTFDSNLSQNSNKKSFFNLEIPNKKTSIVLESKGIQFPVSNSGQKSAKIEINCGQNFRHISDYSSNQPEVHRLRSLTNDFRSGSPLYNFEYNYGLEPNSHSIDCQLNQNYLIDGKYNGNNGKVLDLSLKDKRRQLEQNLVIHNLDNQVTIDGLVKKSSANLIQLNSQLSKHAHLDSQLDFKLPRAQTRAFLTVNPQNRKLKVQFNNPRVDHVTGLQWPLNDFNLDSKTTFDSDVYSVAGSHGINRKQSFISIKSPKYDLSGHVEQQGGIPSAKVHVITPKVSHVTEVVLNREKNNIQVQSRTDRKSNKENILNLDLNYNHLNQEIPSTFGLKFGSNSLKLNGKSVPFGTGNRYLYLTAEHPEYTHVTDLQLNKMKNVILKSKTNDKNGNNLMKIDSYLTSGPLNDDQHVTIVTPTRDLHVALQPRDQLARVEYSGPEWTHKTSLKRNIDGEDGSSYGLSSFAKNLRENQIFDLKSDLNPKKSFKIQFKSPQWQHVSTIATPTSNTWSDWHLNSETLKNQNIYNKLKIIPKDGVLEVHVPHFQIQSTWSPEEARVDFKQRIPVQRHVLGSVRLARDWNSFGMDLGLDLQKNPEQRLKVDWEAREVNDQHVHVLKTNYAGNEVRVQSQVQKRNALWGPNTWSVVYVPKYNPEKDMWEVRVSHVIKEATSGSGKQMECRAEVKEANREKYSATLRTKLTEQEMEMDFESKSESNKDLNLNLSIKTRVKDLKGKNAQIIQEIKAIKDQNKEYAFNWRVTRDGSEEGVVRGQGAIETPSLGKKEMEFELNFRKKNSITLSAKSTEKKLFEFKGQLESRDNEKHVFAELKSNLEDIPSISVFGDYLNRKEISFRFLNNGQSKAEVSLIRTGSDYQNGSDVTLKIETNFWPKIESKISAKKNSKEIDFEFVTKMDAKEVFSAIISAKKSTSGSGLWTGSAQVSQNGSQLAKMALEQTSGPLDAFSYVFSAKSNSKNSYLKPISAKFQIQKTGNERKFKINICQQMKENCFDLNGKYVLTRDSRVLWPQRAEIFAKNSGNSLEFKTSFFEEIEDKSEGNSILGLNSGKVNQKTRNELFFAINEHKIGFEHQRTIRSGKSGNKEDYLKISLLNGKELEFKSDFCEENQIIRHKLEIRDLNQQKVIFNSEFKAKRNQNEIQFQLDFTSGLEKKNIEFWFEKPSKNEKIEFKSKLIFGGNEPKNGFEIRAEVQRKPENNELRQQRSSWSSLSSSESLNNTFVLQIQTKDKKTIDFEFSGHLSSKTFGLEFNNLNRNQRKEFLNIFVTQQPSSGEEKRFKAFYSTNQKRFSAEGAWSNNNELNYRIRDEKKNQLIGDVRVAVKGKCVTWEVRSESAQKRKFEFCANFEQKEQKSLELSLEETSSGTNNKHLSLNVELDTRNRPEVKVDAQWSPEAIKEWMSSYGGINYENNYLKDVFNEIFEEFSHKWIRISNLFKEEVLLPISDNYGDLFQELARWAGPLERVVEVWRVLEDSIYNVLNNVKERSLDKVGNVWRPLTRYLRKECNKMEICYKLVYGLEKYGLSALWDYLEWNSVKLMKESHRLIVQTSGKLIYSLPVPEWIKDYRQSIYSVWDSIIDSNPTLRSILTEIQVLFKEMTKEWNLINGTEVKKSFKQLFELLFNIESQRVVFYDPSRGRFSLIVKNEPILKRSQRSLKSKE